MGRDKYIVLPFAGIFKQCIFWCWASNNVYFGVSNDFPHRLKKDRNF